MSSSEPSTPLSHDHQETTVASLNGSNQRLRPSNPSALPRCQPAIEASVPPSEGSGSRGPLPDDATLTELLNISLKSPDFGNVNYRSLYVLLEYLLTRLNVANERVDLRERPSRETIRDAAGRATTQASANAYFISDNNSPRGISSYATISPRDLLDVDRSKNLANELRPSDGLNTPWINSHISPLSDKERIVNLESMVSALRSMVDPAKNEREEFQESDVDEQSQLSARAPINNQLKEIENGSVKPFGAAVFGSTKPKKGVNIFPTGSSPKASKNITGIKTLDQNSSMPKTGKGENAGSGSVGAGTLLSEDAGQAGTIKSHSRGSGLAAEWQARMQAVQNAAQVDAAGAPLPEEMQTAALMTRLDATNQAIARAFDVLDHVLNEVQEIKQTKDSLIDLMHQLTLNPESKLHEVLLGSGLTPFPGQLTDEQRKTFLEQKAQLAFVTWPDLREALVERVANEEQIENMSDFSEIRKDGNGVSSFSPLESSLQNAETSDMASSQENSQSSASEGSRTYQPKPIPNPRDAQNSSGSSQLINSRVGGNDPTPDLAAFREAGQESQPRRIQTLNKAPAYSKKGKVVGAEMEQAAQASLDEKTEITLGVVKGNDQSKMEGRDEEQQQEDGSSESNRDRASPAKGINSDVFQSLQQLGKLIKASKRYEVRLARIEESLGGLLNKNEFKKMSDVLRSDIEKFKLLGEATTGSASADHRITLDEDSPGDSTTHMSERTGSSGRDGSKNRSRKRKPASGRQIQGEHEDQADTSPTAPEDELSQSQSLDPQETPDGTQPLSGADKDNLRTEENSTGKALRLEGDGFATMEQIRGLADLIDAQRHNLDRSKVRINTLHTEITSLNVKLKDQLGEKLRGPAKALVQPQFQQSKTDRGITGSTGPSRSEFEIFSRACAENFEMIEIRLSDLENILETHRQKIEGVQQHGVKLLRGKADAEFVAKELSQKADVSSLDGKVDQTLFEDLSNHLHEKLMKLGGDLHEQGDSLHQNMNSLLQRFEDKISSDDYNILQEETDKNIDFVLKRITAIEKHFEVDDAAGSKTPIRSFTCVSCDKPVDPTWNDKPAGWPHAYVTMSVRPHLDYVRRRALKSSKCANTTPRLKYQNNVLAVQFQRFIREQECSEFKAASQHFGDAPFPHCAHQEFRPVGGQHTTRGCLVNGTRNRSNPPWKNRLDSYIKEQKIAIQYPRCVKSISWELPGYPDMSVHSQRDKIDATCKRGRSQDSPRITNLKPGLRPVE